MRGADVLVIGAGSAGGVLASRLSEDPGCSVLLVDAGPDFADPGQVPPEIVVGRAAGIGVVADAPSTPDDYLWRFRAEVNGDQPERSFARGRLVGGSSAINGQVLLPALREDFERWVALGNDEWSWDHVAPHFDAVFDTVGARRYPPAQWCAPAQAFYAAARARGFPHCEDDHAPGSTGVGPATHNNAGDRRQSVLTTYLATARRRPNLTILPRSAATRITFAGRRATGAELRGPGGLERVSADQVVVSAGALASPHLLMLSGLGPAGELQRLGIELVEDLPGVGENLGEHPFIHLLWRARDGMACPPTLPGHPVALRYTSPGSPHLNDAKMYMHNSVPAPPGSELDMAGLVGSLANLDQVASRGRLRLTTPDIGADPAVFLNLLHDAGDWRRMTDAVALMLELLRSPEMAGVVADLHTPVTERDLAGWTRRSVAPAMHACGTCAMGPADDALAVVDQHCRVRGVDNLRVVDASVLPEVPRANLNATVMMLGERLADLLR